jgi:hypothetical protein
MKGPLSSLDDLINDPDFFLDGLYLHAHAAVFYRISAEGYRKATFLDDSIRLEQLGYLVPLDALFGNEQVRSQRPLHLLVNTGYCCSTLISRCIEELGPFLVLKEPRVLKRLNRLYQTVDLDKPGNKEWLRSLLGTVAFFLGRTYDSNQSAVIKPFELDNPVTTELLSLHPSSTVLFLYPDLKEFLARVLKGKIRIDEMRDRSNAIPGAVAALEEFRGKDLNALSDPQITALVWIHEMHSHMELCASSAPERIKSIAAQKFLAAPAEALRKISLHFGTPASDAAIQRVVSGGLLHAHAKNPKVTYNARVAEREVEKIVERSKPLIDEAMGFAENVLSRHPLPSPLPSDIFLG